MAEGVNVQTLFHSSADRLLSDPELSPAESPLADKKAPGSERAAERAAAAQQNSERARLASRPSYVNMQVTVKWAGRPSTRRGLGGRWRTQKLGFRPALQSKLLYI